MAIFGVYITMNLIPLIHTLLNGKSLERFIETKIEILHKWHAYSINYEVQRIPDSKRGPFLTNGRISGVIEKFDDFSKEPSEYLK